VFRTSLFFFQNIFFLSGSEKVFEKYHRTRIKIRGFYSKIFPESFRTLYRSFNLIIYKKMFTLLEIGNSLNNIAMIYPLQILLVGVLLLLGIYVLYHSTGLSRGFGQRKRY